MESYLLFQWVSVPVVSPTRTVPVTWFSFVIKDSKEQRQNKPIHQYFMKIEVIIGIKSRASYKFCHNSRFIVKREMNESKKIIQNYAYFYSCCIMTLILMVVVLSIIR